VESKSSLSITVEINPPLRGTNPRVGGIFALSDDGDLLLLHRGNIGGGRVGVGKNLFWQKFQGRPQFVHDGAEIVDCALVSNIEHETVVEDLYRFASDVARMKESVRGS
jgi:5-methylcytosine-specific restriction enzyme A